MNKINELQPRQGNIEVIGTISEKGEVRAFEKFGKEGKVCSAKLKDDSGDCTLSLWNEQADQFNVGDKVHLTNGYAGEWQGEIQLSTGKFGKLEKVEGESMPEQETSEKETPEKENFKNDSSEPNIDISEEDIE